LLIWVIDIISSKRCHTFVTKLCTKKRGLAALINNLHHQRTLIYKWKDEKTKAKPYVGLLEEASAGEKWQE
jgi:hypothetical protein